MPTNIKSYKDLLVWQKAVDLSTEIYKLCKNFPKDEIFGLSSQMKRAAVSIPSNIAEGRNRSTRKNFCHFLYLSLGSASELETQVMIAKRLGFIKSDIAKVDNLIEEISKMIHGMINKLEANS